MENDLLNAGTIRRIAIIYTSEYGQTAKIAGVLKQQLDASGARTSLYSLQSVGTTLLQAYDAFIIGAPVYVGKFDANLIKWTKANAKTLTAKPCAFFSVSLNRADPRPEARIVDERLVNDFLKATDLKPSLTTSLIGALHYRKYNLFIRWLMKRISSKAGGPVDMSRDHELTVWEDVAKFGNDFISLMQAKAPVESSRR